MWRKYLTFPIAATSQPAGSLFGGIKPAGDATATGTALKFGLSATSTQATTNAAQTTTTATTGLAFGQLSTAAGQQPTKVSLLSSLEFSFSRHIVFWST